MGRIVHFEINADNLERAVKFYENVFNWKIEKFEAVDDYWLITTGEENQPGIDGGLQKRDKPGASVYNVIDVDSLEEALKKIEKNGGKIVSKEPVPGVGYSAYFIDSEGNQLGLIERDESAK